MAVGSITVDEEGNATGDGLSFRIFTEILAGKDADVVKVVAARAAPFCEGLARALDHEDERFVDVGKADWQYQTIQEGVDAAVALTPAAGNRVCVRIGPGYYDMTERIDVPSWVEIRGASRRLTQLHNATTDMFRVTGGGVWFRDFLIEGAANNSVYAFDGNNQTGISVTGVDMLNNGGTSTQKFLKNSGSTWTTLFLKDCVIDSYAASGYMIFLENTSGAVRGADVHAWDLFVDTLHLTNYGGAFLIRDFSDVSVRHSEIRGAATYHTGVRIERTAGATGTADLKVQHAYIAGGVPVYGTANSNYLLANTDAVGALTAGTRTLRNSSVT